MAKYRTVCPKGHEVRTGAQYCYECGRKLVTKEVREFKDVRGSTKPLNVVAKCSRCDWDLDASDKFCCGCGRPIHQKKGR